MNINTVSASRVQTARVFTAASETTTSNGPKDTVEPGLNWGEFRSNPTLMAGAGFVTTVGSGILGHVASAIHPLASTIVGGVAGAAVGYHLLPAEAGGAEKVTASLITGALGAVCGYAGGNTNVATNAILAVVGAGGGFAAGHMIKTAQAHGLS